MSSIAAHLRTRPRRDAPSGQERELSFIERARRTQIIGAAAPVVAEEGIGQASLARIATRAGVSKGVVSYHFAGKDDLMKQVVLAVYEAGAQAMAPAIAAASTPREPWPTTCAATSPTSPPTPRRCGP